MTAWAILAIIGKVVGGIIVLVILGIIGIFMYFRYFSKEDIEVESRACRQFVKGVKCLMKDQGYHDKAIKYYKKAIALNDHGMFHLFLAAVLESTGKVGEAKEEYAKANRMPKGFYKHCYEVPETALDKIVTIPEQYCKSSDVDDLRKAANKLLQDATELNTQIWGIYKGELPISSDNGEKIMAHSKSMLISIIQRFDEILLQSRRIVPNYSFLYHLPALELDDEKIPLTALAGFGFSRDLLSQRHSLTWNAKKATEMLAKVIEMIKQPNQS